MAFRNRPVLDRKHRPRWQDELRTQQLLVAGFALAIAVAVGIFAATAWSSFFQANLKQAALVGGTAVDRGQILTRVDILASEIQARAVDLQNSSGGARGELIQQQLSSLQNAIQQVNQSGAESLVTGMALDLKAERLGIRLPDGDVDAELASRMTIPERRLLSMIMAFPRKDEDAKAEDKPTEANWAAARQRIEDLKAQIEDGADFGTLARDQSDDNSKTKDGLLGWIQADDPEFGEYFTAAADAEVGDLVGPIRNNRGWYILEVEDIRASTDNVPLEQLLSENGVSEAAYREYVRQELLRDRFRTYFETRVLTPFQPQRNVSQIRIDNDRGVPGPKVRVRHLLVAPIPGAEDQTVATDEQWADALEKARRLRRDAVKPDADWSVLAKESDDPGSRSRGGMLGWYSLGELGQTFVPEFATAAGQLDVGEISRPVRSDFGYHIIQVVEQRATAMDYAEQLAAELREDPDSFAAVAREKSDDATSAGDGGELGWIVHYQLDAERDEAIFAMTEKGQISEPLVTDTAIYIFKLNDLSDHRIVTTRQRSQVSSSGFTRWLEELKGDVGIWLDTEFAAAATGI
jgi:parvulin-like peptidyl-prolyl isomerase